MTWRKWIPLAALAAILGATAVAGGGVEGRGARRPGLSNRE